ncbi:hypothetical protein [Hoylesella saccharolytica]|uniref:hypothetical protein n=1 Tax=Hoylesella saccharolytica TaxID=633701 RepID=UPI000472DEFC|nr:hypothetical protein [Hoylesella saccharolytica]
MNTSLINLNEKASETLNMLLDSGYLEERIKNIDSIENLLMDQWRDFKSVQAETALTFLDTLRCLRKDFGTLLESVAPEETR